MWSKWIALLTGGVIFFAPSCVTVPTEPFIPGELRLLTIEVPGAESIGTSLHYLVKVTFESDGKSKIRKACFYWSGDGPYCHRVKEVDYGPPGTFRVWLRTDNPGFYRLECYVEYFRDGEIKVTNVISSQITVR